MKCPRCQQENPPQAKFCLECAAGACLGTSASNAITRQRVAAGTLLEVALGQLVVEHATSTSLSSSPTHTGCSGP